MKLFNKIQEFLKIYLFLEDISWRTLLSFSVILENEFICSSFTIFFHDIGNRGDVFRKFIGILSWVGFSFTEGISERLLSFLPLEAFWFSTSLSVRFLQFWFDREIHTMFVIREM